MVSRDTWPAWAGVSFVLSPAPGTTCCLFGFARCYFLLCAPSNKSARAIMPLCLLEAFSQIIATTTNTFYYLFGLLCCLLENLGACVNCEMLLPSHFPPTWEKHTQNKQPRHIRSVPPYGIHIDISVEYRIETSSIIPAYRIYLSNAVSRPSPGMASPVFSLLTLNGTFDVSYIIIGLAIRQYAAWASTLTNQSIPERRNPRLQRKPSHKIILTNT